jgi:hypothetical protein
MTHRTVPLTRGLVALVDEGDYAHVIAGGSWSADRDHRTFYARRTDSVRRSRKIAMHTFLTGWPLVDHINGDGLDNRRANLRPATDLQNRGNRRLSAHNTSGFKGVTWLQRERLWLARCWSDGKLHRLGYHRTAEAAAHAYDAAAREIFGEFAALNFPLPGERSCLR